MSIFHKVQQQIVTTGGGDSLLITQRKNEKGLMEKGDTGWKNEPLSFSSRSSGFMQQAGFLAGQLVDVSVGKE